MTLPIAEDFAAIAARLREIEATERPEAAAARPAVPAQYAGFYHWLTGGGAWAAPATGAEPAEG
ncbi:hypothetical protein [Siccirubricoccus phaeus]|uniref:hypothetical protein n=1 Tax=Siccirubricoccus phaeus TaxID=2595053 RepID=UPI0011F0EAF8|nr:hypothetical protein [Siccirubricoccus phaeus]